MAKKKKNKDIRKKINNEKVDNKTEEKLDKEDKKKAFMWLIFLPPYGLYLMIKSKMIHKGIATALAILFVLVGVVSYDMVANPYRVEDTLAKKAVTAFSTAQIGNIRVIDRIGTVSLTNRKYHKYNVYTDIGKYCVYFGSDNGKSYTVEGVYSVEPEKSLVYVSSGSKDVFNDLFPEINEFLDENKDKFGNFKTVKQTFDNATQQIETSKGFFRVMTKFDQVAIVIREEGDKQIHEYEVKPVLELLPGIKKIQKQVEKYTGEIISVFDYENISTKRVQYVETEKGKFKIDLYDDGRWQVFEYMGNKDTVD